MKTKLTICALALSTACWVPFAAMAQTAAAPTPVPAIPDTLLKPMSTSELTIGTQWVGGHNTGQYGRYNGFTTNGLGILLGFSFEKRDGWDSSNTSYYNISGLNLDLQTGGHLTRTFRDSNYMSSTSNRLGPNAELNLSFGEQGKWGVTARYDATSYTGNIISSLWTIDNAVGTLNNNMLPFGGASNSPLTRGTVTSWNTATLTPNFKQFETGVRRDKVEVAGKLVLDEWTFSTAIQHEHKRGSIEESIRETYGGMPFTLPVDYDTDRFDVSASYIDTDFQALIQYTYSHFTDYNLGVTLPYVVSVSTLTATSGPYALAAFYSTPPSNSAHYVTAMFSDKLSTKTRLVFNGRVGLELQNNPFPPNSADPNLSSTLGNPTFRWFANLNSRNQGTTANSLEASAVVYQGNLSINTELAEHLEGRASYSIDGRNVDTNQYKVFFGGASLDTTANSFNFSVVQNWVKQNGSIELGYLIIPESSTKVTVNYTFNDTSRSNAQVGRSITNTESIQLSSMLGKNIIGRLSYEHAHRTGVLHYGTAWGNLDNGVPDLDGTPSGAFYQAPMIADAVTLRADYAPEGNLSGGLFLKFANNHYHYPEVESVATPTNAGKWSLAGVGQGITRDYNLTIGPDINYRPSDTVDLHTYYTYERIFFDNRGNGACAENNTGNCVGSAGYFQNTYTSDTHTAGVSGDWKLSDRLKLLGEYNVSVGSVIFGEYNGVMVTTVTQSYQNVTPYPDIDSTMHDLKVTAIYQFTDNIDGSLIYRYSMFNNNDWQYVPVPAIPTTNTGTTISILNAGYGPPNYNVSSIGLVARMRL